MVVGGPIGRKTMPPFNTNLNKNVGVIFLVKIFQQTERHVEQKLFECIVKASNNLGKKLHGFIKAESITFNSNGDVYETNLGQHKQDQNKCRIQPAPALSIKFS